MAKYILKFDPNHKGPMELNVSLPNGGVVFVSHLVPEKAQAETLIDGDADYWKKHYASYGLKLERLPDEPVKQAKGKE